MKTVYEPFIIPDIDFVRSKINQSPLFAPAEIDEEDSDPEYETPEEEISEPEIDGTNSNQSGDPDDEFNKQLCKEYQKPLVYEFIDHSSGISEIIHSDPTNGVITKTIDDEEFECNVFERVACNFYEHKTNPSPTQIIHLNDESQTTQNEADQYEQCLAVAEQFVSTKDISVLTNFFESHELNQFDIIINEIHQHGDLSFEIVCMLLCEPVFFNKTKPFFDNIIHTITDSVKEEAIQFFSSGICDFITNSDISSLERRVNLILSLLSYHSGKLYVKNTLNEMFSCMISNPSARPSFPVPQIFTQPIQIEDKSPNRYRTSPRVAGFNFQKSPTNSPKIPQQVSCYKDLAVHRLQEASKEIGKLKNEIKTLREQIEEKENVILEHTKQIKHLSDKNKTLQDKLEELKLVQTDLIQENTKLKEENKTQKALLAKKASYSEVLAYFDNHMPQYTTLFGWTFLKDMFVSCHIEPHGRKHSTDFKKFAYLLYNCSPKAYRILHTHFPFPTHNTFAKFCQSDENDLKALFFDSQAISNYICNHFGKVYPTNGTPHRATLAIDAIAIQPTSVQEIKTQIGSVKVLRSFNKQTAFVKENMTKKQQQEFETAIKADPTSEAAKASSINSAFIFYMQPADPSLPCFPVHILLKKGGSANAIVRKLTEQIINIIEETGIFEIVAVSTDGDNGYNVLYDLVYNKLLEMSPRLDIDEILSNEMRFTLRHLGAADLLHLFKTLRARFLLNNIDIFPSREIIMDKDILKTVLKPGPEIEDTTQIGKMRDIYAINFFTFENLKRLIDTNNRTGVLLFTPFVCWARAAFDSVLSLNTRIVLLKISYEFIKRYYLTLTCTDRNEWKNTMQKNYEKNASALTIATESVMRRMISTLFVLISELSDWQSATSGEEWPYSDESKLKQLAKMHDLGIERYNTHPLENFNGFIREESNHKDGPMTIQSVLAKSQIMKSLCIDLDIPIKKRSRANTGGLKVSEFIPIAEDLSCNPSVLVNSLFAWGGVVNPLVLHATNIDENEINAFFKFVIETNIMSQLAFVQKIRLGMPSKSANSTIQSRNIAYQFKT